MKKTAFLALFAALCGLVAGPAVLGAQQALVYCPAGIDVAGCDLIVASLTGAFPGGVARAYDGTSGTVDLARADLAPYAVFIVPSLADNGDTKPYDLLRTTAVAERLRIVLRGRIAVWSGTTADARGGAGGGQVVLVSSAGNGNTTATVKTDKEDYAPGEVVTMTGSGWRPGEAVTLELHEDLDHDEDTDQTLTTTADSSGSILYREFAPDEYDLGVQFYLTATGQTSRSVAQTTFLDSPKVGSVTVGAQSPDPVTPGSSAAFTITVFRGSGGGSSGNFSATLSITTALPAGASAFFTANPVTLASAENSKTSTLTISTTSGTTPAGTTALTVKAATSASDFATGSGTLTVGKRNPTVTFTGAPASAAYLSSFTVTSTTNSSASPIYTSSGGCSNIGTTYTMTSGTATCAAAVTWAPDADYNGTTLSQTTTATKISPTVTFTGAPASAAYQSTFTVASTTNSSASPVYASGGVCSNAGPTYTMTSGTGTCTSTVTWAADASYNAATRSQTTTAEKITPTVTFTGAPASAAYQSTFTVASSTNSSASPVYTSGGVCSNLSIVYTMSSGTGSCTATVTWAADDNYTGATRTQTTTAEKITPTVTFTGAPANAAYLSAFTVASSTNSTASPVYT